jgi:hypothetical protein
MTRWFFVVALVACRSDADLDPTLPPDGATHIDARTDAPAVDAKIDSEDGAPMRRACTDSFGTALSPSYGRLDGFLVAIVEPGSGGCRADPDHLHLQILVNGAVYDIAANVGSDVLSTTRDQVVDTTPWTEGWHPFDGIDYTTIDVHSSDITTAVDETSIDSDLATTNHITIYATGYDETGAHLVHRNNGADGAIVTRVLSAVPHVRMFRFTDQSF